MTLPLLLLGLYLGLLAISLSIASWVGHATPAPNSARRVTDAAERAALRHLKSPAKIASVVLLVASFLFTARAALSDGPLLWSLLASILPPIVVGASLFYSSRKGLRTTGQLIGAPGVDGHVSISSKMAMSVILCVDATVGLVLLGLHSVAARDLGNSQAVELVVSASACIGVTTLSFGRAACASSLTSDPMASPDATSVPDPSSLATLLNAGFHGPLLKLLSLVALSAVGHSALLIAGSKQDSLDLWLYPHLLKLLGLFALLFSGAVVRASEDEPGSHGWTRGLIVYFVLIIAGAWSLGAELPKNLARVVPAVLTFLLLSFGASVWISSPRNTPSSSFRILPQALDGLKTLVVLLLLLALMVFAVTESPEDVGIAEVALLSLILSTMFAATPIAVHWLLGRELISGAARARTLSQVGNTGLPDDAVRPSSRGLSMLALAGLCVGTAGLTIGISSNATGGVFLFLFGIGLMLGAGLQTGLFGLVERGCEKSCRQLRHVVDSHVSKGDTGELNFEAGIEITEQATSRLAGAWLTLCSAPVALLAIAGALSPPDLMLPFALGLGFGFIALGIGLEWLLATHKLRGRRCQGTLALLTGLVQTACLIAAFWAPPSSQGLKTPAPSKEPTLVNNL